MSTPASNDRLPSAFRVSFQPEMAGGLNGTELILVIGGGFGTMVGVSLLAWPILGVGHVALLTGTVAGTTLAFGLRAGIVVLKRQRPDGYVQQVILSARHRWWPQESVIARHGLWDFYRHER